MAASNSLILILLFVVAVAAVAAVAVLIIGHYTRRRPEQRGFEVRPLEDASNQP